MSGATGVPHRCSYCDRYGHKRPTCPEERANIEYAAQDVAILVLTEEERLAVAAVIGHALDQAHDDHHRDYLQVVVGDYENATEDREEALEALLGGVVDRLAKAAS